MVVLGGSCCEGDGLIGADAASFVLVGRSNGIRGCGCFEIGLALCVLPKVDLVLAHHDAVTCLKLITRLLRLLFRCLVAGGVGESGLRQAARASDPRRKLSSASQRGHFVIGGVQQDLVLVRL